MLQIHPNSSWCVNKTHPVNAWEKKTRTAGTVKIHRKKWKHACQTSWNMNLLFLSMGSLKIWEWYGKLTIRGSHYWGSLESPLILCVLFFGSRMLGHGCRWHQVFYGSPSVSGTSLMRNCSAAMAQDGTSRKRKIIWTSTPRKFNSATENSYVWKDTFSKHHLLVSMLNFGGVI